MLCSYAAAKHAYDTEWPLKQDDFFPYADFPHSYWTGAQHGLGLWARLLRAVSKSSPACRAPRVRGAFCCDLALVTQVLALRIPAPAALGYFTSRAASKGFVRVATSYLQVARQLEAFMGRADEQDGGAPGGKPPSNYPLLPAP